MKKCFYTSFAALFLTFSLFSQSTTPPSVSEQAEVKRTVSRVMEKTINGKKWELTLVNDDVTEVKVNGKKLPKSAWAKYQTEVDDLRASAYDLDPEASKATKDGIVKEQEVAISDSGDLTPEQKATQRAIEDEMMTDKLIKERSYQLVLTEKTMSVNGKTMPKETIDKYIIIYYTHSGEQRCEGCRFKLQVNKQAK